METTSLSVAAAAALLAVAEMLTPAPDSVISKWVAQGHVILSARTNTPKPGPFSFDGVEYIIEPLDRCHPDDPATRIPVIGGAQVAKSAIGQLWVAWSIANNPESFAIGLPSDGEIAKYNDLKLAPIIEDSPALSHRVRPVSTKSEHGSSTRVKRLIGGQTLRIFNFASPKELQMISTGNLILEEVGNAMVDVGGRGSPITQARKRQSAYSVIGSKELMVSTPGEKDQCEITKAYEAGDQRKYYGLCPHCEECYFPLDPEGFRPASGSWGPHFLCPECGSPLQDADRASWRRSGVWLATFASQDESNPSPGPSVSLKDLERFRQRGCEGREPSYYMWQAMCGLISMEMVAKDIAAAKTPAEIKALEQQTYGRAYDPAVEALDWEDLLRLAEPYPRGIVPTGCGLLTAFCDVQAHYLQWGVYGWAPGAEWFVVDRGVILGDTAGDDVWRDLDEVTRRVYEHADGGQLPIEAFGVDTGFRTQRCYAFVAGRPNCYAMDGRGDWKTPILGKPKVVRRIQNKRVVGRIKLYPTGTWELKSLLAWSLKLSLESGPHARVQGRGHWSKDEGQAWCQQITAEVLCEEKDEKTGETERWWKKVRDNEDLDIWVGARALAWERGVGAPRRDGRPGDAIDWAGRAAQRTGKAGTATDLFQEQPAPGIETAKPPQSEAPEPAPERQRKWFRKRT